mgnify:CR=1 FL=1
MKINKRYLSSIFLSCFLMFMSVYNLNFAQSKDSKEVVAMVLGKSDAPLKIVEYASFTCPHCATFHLQILPKIKEDYIDKGQVQIEYREVYFDGPGLWAGLLARCKGDEKYFAMIDLIFEKQKDWARGNIDDTKAGLLSIGRQAGLTDSESLTCMQDDALAEKMVLSFQENSKRDGVSSTPSFLINGKLVRNMPYEELQEIIEKYLD